MRIVTVIGARPQIIKSAVLSNALRKETSITEYVIHTGQHYDYEMSELFYKQLHIRSPFCNLQINQRQSDALSVAEMITALEPHIRELHPDMVVVIGDTNSTLAGALSAAKNKIPVAHIEAGLRCFNLSMQEELNRVITDSISSLAFCPGADSYNRLAGESAHYPSRKVINSGDILLDSLLACRELIGAQQLPTDLPSHFILATIHRAENVDDPEKLAEIIRGLNEIHPQTPVVFTVHPRTKAKIEAAGLELRMIHLPPVGYFEILHLITKSDLVITDSGGIQREAYYLQKPSMVIRERTEWVELTDCGYSSLSKPQAEAILNAFKVSVQSRSLIRDGLYGDGQAASVICEALTEFTR